jgi:hypothetical protein
MDHLQNSAPVVNLAFDKRFDLAGTPSAAARR